MSVHSNLLNARHYPASFLSLGNESIKLLYNRFGHPDKHTLQAIIKFLTLHSVNNNSIDFCDAYQHGKLHQLYFLVIEIKTKTSLELLYTDLWGPAFELSMDGYKYYISFVDNFTRYCWIFPLTLKFEALDTFKYFKILVEK